MPSNWTLPLPHHLEISPIPDSDKMIFVSNKQQRSGPDYIIAICVLYVYFLYVLCEDPYVARRNISNLEKFVG